ncbi:hypothetical protein WA026_009225 [Henosepilachna vigintioctopunctata]|uniref:HTH psq-type domain-containing protein n=1 Tax=Henosepilachna vigintioctopunctata TaxID=420089 RepID=A0AAW1UN37_9CUCU
MVTCVVITGSFLQKFRIWQKKRQKLYFRYSEEFMAKAIVEIRNSSSVKAAEQRYNIPRMTLENKISGKTPENRKDPKTVLSENEKQRLVNWIIEISNNKKNSIRNSAECA